MKPFMLVALIMLVPFLHANAQLKLSDVSSNYDSLKNCDTTTRPLSNPAFDRFLTDHFSYTILGSAAPATGLKVETANPSISLKGTLAKSSSNDEILTLELTTGADSKIMQVFSDNKLSTYFKATFGYSILPWSCKKLHLVNSAHYEDENPYILCQYRTAGVQKYNELVKQREKTEVIKAMLNIEFLNEPTFQKLKDLLISMNLKDQVVKDYSVDIMRDLGIEFMQYDIRLAQFAASIKNYKLASDKKMQFMKQYEKELLIEKGAVDSLFKFEIDQVKSFYTSKFVFWLNGSPYIANTNFKYFQHAPDTLMDRSSFTFGAKLSLNLYWKNKEPHRFTYLSIGITPQVLNSLDDMDRFSYKKSTQQKPNGTETLSTDETGTAYDGLYNRGFGMEYFSEFYSVFGKGAYVPGAYAKVSYTQSKYRINESQLACYAGMVWNITNGDKDAKNLLTIVPYAGWTNMLTQYTDVAKTKTKPMHSLFTAGIQVGIPINIAK